MQDRFTVRAVVVFLGILAIASLFLGSLLSFFDKSVPDFIVAIGSGSLSALGTLLAKTSMENSQVEISNTPQNPVPVNDAGSNG